MRVDSLLTYGSWLMPTPKQRSLPVSRLVSPCRDRTRPLLPACQLTSPQHAPARCRAGQVWRAHGSRQQAAGRRVLRHHVTRATPSHTRAALTRLSLALSLSLSLCWGAVHMPPLSPRQYPLVLLSWLPPGGLLPRSGRKVRPRLARPTRRRPLTSQHACTAAAPPN